MKKKKYVIFFLLSLLFLSYIPLVKAEQLTIVKRMEYKVTPGARGQAQQYISYVTHQGYPAICIEPAVDMHFGNKYQIGSLTSVMADQAKHFSRFMSYAFMNGLGDHHLNYAAAQIYAWYLKGYQPTIVDGPYNHQIVWQRIQDILAKVRQLESSILQLKDISSGQIVAQTTGDKLIFHQAIKGHRYQLTRLLQDFEIKGFSSSIKAWSNKDKLFFDVDETMVKEAKKINVFTTDSKNKNYVLYGQGLQKLAIYKNEEIADFQLEVQAKTYSLQLQKEDKETKRPQGDVHSFDAAKYQLLNKNKEVINTFYLHNGISNLVDGLLPNEAYYLKEISAPIGMRLNKNLHLIYTNEETMLNLKNNIRLEVVQDEVKEGMIVIHKYLGNSEEADFLKPENKSEFTAILKSYVQRYGSFKEALKNIHKMSVKEYSIFTTNEKGIAKSSKLAYGTYVVKQTKAGNKNISLLTKEFIFQVDNDGQLQDYFISNIVQKFYVKLVKIDQKTKQKIQLSPATFKIRRIKDEFGKDINETVCQKIGNKVYDLFQTNAKNEIVIAHAWQNASDNLSELNIPLALKAGVYEVEEIKAPNGFIKSDKFNFYLDKTSLQRKDENGHTCVLIPVLNTIKTASLHIQKTWQDWLADVDVSQKDFHDVKFRLYAMENIYSPLDGSLVMAKGTIAKNIFGQEIGIIGLNKDGRVQINNLFFGHYQLQEIATSNSYILDTVPKDIILKEQDTEITDYFLTWQNDVTKVEVIKSDLSDKKVIGAHLAIKDEKGVIIDQWISTDKSHRIQGLKRNKNYFLEEIEAPNGYAIALRIPFQVFNDSKIKSLRMVNKSLKVYVHKVDQKGHIVHGAKLLLLNEDRKKIAEWISSDMPWLISKYVKGGKKYFIQEEKTPFGYCQGKEKEIYIPKYVDLINISFINELKKFTVLVEKSDQDNQKYKIKGAIYRLYHTNDEIVRDENKKPIDLITNEKGLAIKKLDYDKTGYYLKEIKAPPGYLIENKKYPIVIKSFFTTLKVDVSDQKKKPVLTGNKNFYNFLFIIANISFLGTLIAHCKLKN